MVIKVESLCLGGTAGKEGGGKVLERVVAGVGLSLGLRYF